MNCQDAIVLVLVLLAAAYVARSVWVSIARKGGACCDRGCNPGKTNVVQIKTIHAKSDHSGD